MEQPGEHNFPRRTDTDREHYVLGNNPIEINLTMRCSGHIGPDDVTWKMIYQFPSNRHGFRVERESAFPIPIFSTCLLEQTLNLLFQRFPVRIRMIIGVPDCCMNQRALILLIKPEKVSEKTCHSREDRKFGGFHD